MAVDVVAFDVHAGPVAHDAFDHRRDFGGGAGQVLGVDRDGLLLDVPVDEHATAVVARMPFGEQVLVVGTEVGGVRGDGGGSSAPDRVVPGREGGVGEGDVGCAEAVFGEVAAGDVAQVVFAVAAAVGDGADADVGAQGVGDEQHPFPEDGLLDRLAGAGRGELGQHPGA